jgi:miniconductance mechanosensitive channel
MTEWINEYPLAVQLVAISLLGILCVLSYVVSKRILLAAVTRFVENSPVSWDNKLHKHKVFHRLSDLAPVITAYIGIAHIPELHETAAYVIQRIANASMVILVVLAIVGFLNAAHEIYAARPAAKHRPIKGYIQIVKLFLYIMGTIVAITTLLDRSPWMFLSGIGAMTAVIMLVFKDTLLSLVASVQLTSNDMVRVGDWIEVPQHGADGDVIDIALHTVKVENWDRTITAIPTYDLISSGFKNWRNMPIAGGRRIKRSVYIDTSSIHYLADDEIDRLSRFVLLTDYIARKRAELAEYNAAHCPDPAFLANSRRLTNIGTFRAYVDAYLRQHTGINQHMILMVRQLSPTPDGLPIELYCFTNQTAWTAYEAIQSDIFDHVFAIAPEFGLRIYQHPSGHDVKQALTHRWPEKA